MSPDPPPLKKEKRSFIQKIFTRKHPPSWMLLGLRQGAISPPVNPAKSTRQKGGWSIFRVSRGQESFDSVSSNATSVDLHDSSIHDPPEEEEDTSRTENPAIAGISHYDTIPILSSDNPPSIPNHERSSGDSSGQGASRESNDCDTANQHEAQLYQEICTVLVEDVIVSEVAKKAIVELGNEKAQGMVDFLSKVLVEDTLTQREKRRTLHLLSKLAKSAEVFPQSLELEDVQCNLTNPVTGGGYGFIYKGIHEGKPICIKAVRTDSIRGIDRKKLRAHASELILWAHLAHPNILPFLGIYSSKEEVPRVCIVSPWMTNGDLLQYLKIVPDIPRTPLARDIISGLYYLHDFDIVHADLKAKNVLVSGTGRAMLADFGISRLSMTQTTTSTIVAAGTAYWMAPELLLDGEPPSRQSDIWAFACTCYEIITGMTPFGQYHSVPLLIRAFMKGDITPLKPAQGIGWDEGIWLVAMQCWQSDPEKRPEARELLNMVPTFNDTGDRVPEVNPGTRRVGRIDYASIRRILDEVHQFTAERKDEKSDTADIARRRAASEHLELNLHTKGSGVFLILPSPTHSSGKLIHPPRTPTPTPVPSIAPIKINANMFSNMGLLMQPHALGGEHVGRPLNKGRPTFGIGLSEQLARDNVEVPPIMVKCCEAIEKYGMRKQGVYRVNGTTSKIAGLRTKLDEDLDSVDLDTPEWKNGIRNVTSVMKLWLRELPDPLLTYNLHQGFIEAAKIGDKRLRQMRLHERVNDLPDPNYFTLKYFMGHLHRISQHAVENKMWTQKLAIVFGPTLCGKTNQPTPARGKGETPMQDRFHQNLAIETILNHYVDIFVGEEEDEGIPL